MSKIVDTSVGRFRQVIDGTDKWFLWECPGCKQWAHLSEDQWNGKVSVDHASQGCAGQYHETHNFGAELVHRMQAMRLMGYRPWHEEGQDQWATPIGDGVDGTI